MIAAFLLICSATHGIDLECEFKDDSNWNFVSGNGCSVSNALITTQNQTVATINGKDFLFYKDMPVVSISFYGQQTVHFLPKGIEKFFPNLEGIEIYNSKLKSF